MIEQICKDEGLNISKIDASVMGFGGAVVVDIAVKQPIDPKAAERVRQRIDSLPRKSRFETDIYPDRRVG
jgi:hypothetical protein